MSVEFKYVHATFMRTVNVKRIPDNYKKVLDQFNILTTISRIGKVQGKITNVCGEVNHSNNDMFYLKSSRSKIRMVKQDN